MSGSHQAQIFAFMGASGSGKSSAIKQAIARSKPARLLIWDPQGEYAHAGEAVGKLEGLRAELATGARGAASRSCSIRPHRRTPCAGSSICSASLPITPAT